MALILRAPSGAEMRIGINSSYLEGREDRRREKIIVIRILQLRLVHCQHSQGVEIAALPVKRQT